MLSLRNVCGQQYLHCPVFVIDDLIRVQYRLEAMRCRLSEVGMNPATNAISSIIALLHKLCDSRGGELRLNPPELFRVWEEAMTNRLGMARNIISTGTRSLATAICAGVAIVYL